MDEILETEVAVETTEPQFDANNRPTPEYLDRVADGIIRGSKRNINLKGEY